jgi:hypothetical protein
MTEADLRRIETELDVELPAEYRETMLQFPIRFLVGNADSALWDDPEALVRQNEELRTTTVAEGRFGHSHAGWPPHFLFIGGDVELSWVLDLRQSPCRVLEVDHWDVSGYEEPYGDALPFKDWLTGYVDDYRKDGVGLTSDEDPDKPIPKACACAALAFILVTAVAGGVLWLVELLRGD